VYVFVTVGVKGMLSVTPLFQLIVALEGFSADKTTSSPLHIVLSNPAST
jgi:hypothetical protein